MTSFYPSVSSIEKGRRATQRRSSRVRHVLVGLFVGCVVGILVGRSVGCDVGILVGRNVGTLVGVLVGLIEGIFVGFWVGLKVGTLLGLTVGRMVGFLVGLRDGDLVGRFVGIAVGTLVGFEVGIRDGACVGFWLGARVDGETSEVVDGALPCATVDPTKVTTVGALVGSNVGLVVGLLVGAFVGTKVGVRVVGAGAGIHPLEEPTRTGARLVTSPPAASKAKSVELKAQLYTVKRVTTPPTEVLEPEQDPTFNVSERLGHGVVIPCSTV